MPVVYSLYVLAGVALLVLALMAMRWLVSVPAAQLATLVKWTVGFLGAVLILFLILRGQFLLVPLVGLATLWPMLKRVWSQVRNAAGPAQGQRSTVETPYLRAERP